jgi:hypothetical protein
VKTRKGSLQDRRSGNSAHAEPKPSVRRLSGAPRAGSPERRTPEKSNTIEKHKTALRSYRFQRARTPGIVLVLNENSYVMAEYSERTGSVNWQRIVLASQREQIEKWLEDHYPKDIN